MIFHRNFLCSQVFFAGYRKPGAGLDSGIVGDNHTLPTAHVTETYEYAATRTATVFLVHIVPGESSDFKESTVIID